MELEELIPEKPEFSISSTNKTYKLRLPNLEDRARFNEMVGGNPEELGKAFTEMRWSLIAKMTYRLMDQKEDFLASEEEFIDDDGNKTKAFVSGPSKLMRALNLTEALKMMGALSVAIRNAEPIPPKEDTESKKKAHPPAK